MLYQEWNAALAARFFNKGMKDRRVYLYVTAELIRSLGHEADSAERDFISVIKRGPEDDVGIGVCVHAQRCFRNWRGKKPPVPPYIAYLAFFSMAAGIEGDFCAHAYYPRLRYLLGEDPIPGTYPGFQEMRQLWDDLETWSQRDQGGELGLFQVRLSTRLIHVGVPISQTILSETEQQFLPRVFAASGLDPAAMPSDCFLAQIVRDASDENLRPRTRRILNEPSEYPEDYEALTDALLQELATWDGTVRQESESQRNGAVHGIIKLWCRNIDLVAGAADFHFLCRTKHEFPEDDLALRVEGTEDCYRCRDFRSGWSTPLEDSCGNEVDASCFNWCSGLRLRETKRGWKFTLSRSPVRILVEAGEEGLDGLVEIQNLPTARSFYLVVESLYWGIVEIWGASACSGFKELRLLSGLPNNWRLYSIERAHDDSAVRDLLPALSLGQISHIALSAGIRAGSNRYFSFALPEVAVYGAPENVTVLCNGKQLIRRQSGLFSFDEFEVTDDKLVVEAEVLSESICRYAFYVESEFAWPQKTVLAWSSLLGIQTGDDKTPRISGALIYGIDAPEFTSWIVPTPLVVRTLETVGKFEETTAVIDIETLEKTAATIDAMSSSEIKDLLDSWKSEVQASVPSEYLSAINERHMGAELTEGCLQYMAGVSRKDPRSFIRAIRELRQASNSSDQIGAKVVEMRCVKLPHQFVRLEWFMNRLAGVDTSAPQPGGFGIEDISPLAVDAALSDSLALETVSGNTSEA